MLTLVSLKLNDVSVIGILNDASVAVELLLEILEHQFLVDLRVESLHRRQALTSVALLHANVNVVFLNRVRGFLLFLLRLFFVSKVKRLVSKGIVGCVSRIRRSTFVSLSFASSSRATVPAVARRVRRPRSPPRVVVVVVSRALVRAAIPRRSPPHSSRARRVAPARAFRGRARRSRVHRRSPRVARARARPRATTFTPKRSNRSPSIEVAIASPRARAARARRAARSTRSTHRTLSRRP